jgi:hypothetical protein
MTRLLLAAAILAALISFGRRRYTRGRLRRAARDRSGASWERAIHLRSYTQMDEHIAGRWCHCGGYLERTGEGTREVGDRRYRIARLRCQECEAPHSVFFDVTDVLQ